MDLLRRLKTNPIVEILGAQQVGSWSTFEPQTAGLLPCYPPTPLGGALPRGSL